MARSKSPTAAPLTFDLPRSLLATIEARRKRYGLKSASETVRLALEEFDVTAYRPNRLEHTQISVRITAPQRKKLRAAAKQKKASVGELIRAAIEALPPRPARR